jgi:hypothetical protein
MAQNPGGGTTSQDRPNIFARSVDKDSVIAVVGAGQAPAGPWSYLTGIPNAAADMVGPPAQYLSVAAWAA